MRIQSANTFYTGTYLVLRNTKNKVCTNGFMEDLHEQGILNDSQNQYDMSLLGMLFGKDANSMRLLLHGCKKSGNFLELLDLYSPDGAMALDKLQDKCSCGTVRNCQIDRRTD